MKVINILGFGFRVCSSHNTINTGPRRASEPNAYIYGQQHDKHMFFAGRRDKGQRMIPIFKPHITHPLNFVESGNNKMVDAIVRELLNPDFSEDGRRRTSIIRAPYREILDPYHSERYPMNCIGTYARLNTDYLESFVNIGRVIKVMNGQNVNGPLGHLVRDAIRDGKSFAELRMALRQTIHNIGYRSFSYEWQDTVTYENIDTLLEGLASYRENNRVVVEKLTTSLSRSLAVRQKLIILDLGSGMGGTSLELLAHLEDMKQRGLIPDDFKDRLQIILFDISDVQLDAATQQLKERHAFENVVRIHGNFGDLNVLLQDFRGRVDVMISGAAICHVIDKLSFFKQLHDVMSNDSVMSFWDPAMTLYPAQLIRESEGLGGIVHYRISDGSDIKLMMGDMISGEESRRVADKSYVSTAHLSSEEIIVFAAGIVNMYLGQMGYRGDTIGNDNFRFLKNKLYSDILRDAKTEQGFDLFAWLNTNLAHSDVLQPLDNKHWTPYDLIESVSDEHEYRTALQRAGFISYKFARFKDPTPFDEEDDAVKAVIGHFYAEKGNDASQTKI